jgi:hypothetical protein
MSIVREQIMTRRFSHAHVRHIAVFIAYFGLAALITWPLITRLSTHLYGDFLTDAYQNARHTWWMQYAIQHGQPLYSQPMMNYPDGLGGAWLWSNPIELFPGWLFAFVMDINAAANLMLLVQLALNGWAVYALVNDLTGKAHYPALVAGVVFLTYPAMQGRIYGGHVGVLALWPVPLYLLALYRMRDDDRKRWTVMAAVCFMLGVAGSTSLLVYYLLPISGLFLLGQLLRREWVWFRRSMVATIIGCVLLLGLLLPFALETGSDQQFYTLTGSVRYSADLLSLVTPSFLHPIYKHLPYTGHVLGTNLVEGTGYIGMVTLALAMVAVWKRRQDALVWLVVAGVAWVCSLGPVLNVNGAPVQVQIDQYLTYIPLPWALLQKLPILNISRTPGRFNLSIGLAMAVMAGYGVAVLLSGRGRTAMRPYKRLGVLAVMALIVFDAQMFWPMPSVSVDVPQAVIDLRERDDIRSIFNIPWNDRIHSKQGLYLQTVHEQALLDGLIIRDTPVNPAKLTVLQETLHPLLLDVAGVDVVIWHKGGPLNEGIGERLATWGDPIYEDETLAIYDVPMLSSLPSFAGVPFAGDTITDHADSSLYTDWPGWVTISGVMQGDGQEVTLMLDDEPLHQWLVTGEQPFEVAVPVDEAGFYTLRLDVEPDCPLVDHPALTCPGVVIGELALTNALDVIDIPVDWERGIHLDDWYVIHEARAGERLAVHLSWRFDDVEAIPFDSLSRFVHVLNADGESVAQADGAINLDGALSRWSESPVITLPDDLSPGQYTVVVGWYTYPDTTRLNVFSDAPEAVNGLIEIGAFRVVE